MPRVAMVIQRYLPHLGGTERQLQQIAPRLQALGYEVSILTRHEKGLSRFEVIDGIPVYRLPSWGPKRLAGTIFTVAAVMKLTQLHPDLVHAYEILTPASIATFSKRINKHPVLVKILRGGARGDVYKLKQRPFWKSYSQNLKRNVDAFVVISNEIDQELCSLQVPKEKRVFLPNGVNTEQCSPVSDEEKTRLRSQLSLPLKATIVIYVGRLVSEKRVDHLLEAWKEIHSKYSDACLLIVGEGEEKQRLIEMHVDDVRFIGQVTDAVPYLQAADIFVLPSSTEGLSNSMLEAMSCGLPLLATSVGGAPDVIQHNISGYLISPDDIDALQSGLENLLGDKSFRSTLGSNARARIVSDFSLDSVTESLDSLYDRLLNTRKF